MGELLWAIVELAFLAPTSRTGLILIGLGMGGGGLFMASGVQRHVLIGGILMAVGIAITAIGLCTPSSRSKGKGRHVKPTPDDWKPPDADEIRKIVGR